MSTSCRKPLVMFNDLILRRVLKGVPYLIDTSKFEVWYICFLYQPMWWWGRSKFSQIVFCFQVTLLSVDLSTRCSEQFCELLMFHFPRECVFFPTFLPFNFGTLVWFSRTVDTIFKSVSPCNYILKKESISDLIILFVSWTWLSCSWFGNYVLIDLGRPLIWFYLVISQFQTVITQINHAIGASGIISEECKTMVAQYGKIVLEMLVAQVSIIGSQFFLLSDSLLIHLMAVG